MDLFFQLFHIDIPWQLYLSVSLLSLALSFFIVRKNKERKGQKILIVWIVACLFLMLYISVFKRVPKTEMSINLVPFWSIGAIQTGLIETLYEKIFNVLFFVPYGCLLGAYIRQHCIKRAILIGGATSVAIELLQLLTRTGTCETDDVICNTFGCVIGALIALAFKYFIKNVKKSTVKGD